MMVDGRWWLMVYDGGRGVVFRPLIALTNYYITTT